jgi:hypothetical protein
MQRMTNEKWKMKNGKGEVVYKHVGRVDTAELREAIEKVVKKDGK